MRTSEPPKNPFLYEQPELLDNSKFMHQIREQASSGANPLFYAGSPQKELWCAMAKSRQAPVLLRSPFPPESQYPSLSVEFPAFHIFERELWEEHQITPVGHPWLKPLRYLKGSSCKMEDYPFLSSESAALHEVGVGPVHAGVIEPGHFRFICNGEEIEHLEIQLGYQHRGVAKLFTKGDIRTKMQLAEAIAGDTAIGHGLAYCLAVEALCGCDPDSKINTFRKIALELERIAMHLADLSALAGDIAYLSGLNFFAALRTTIINSSLAICGSRFGKRWLKPGGVNCGLSKEQNISLQKTLAEAETQIINCATAMFGNSGVLNRFDSTGTISRQTALELNMTGVTAKAAGLCLDARYDFPMALDELFEPCLQDSGDVFARAWLRYQEILQSLHLIDLWLKSLPVIEPGAGTELPEPQPDKIAIAITEGWRGRIVHVVKTDSKAQNEFYRICDPSVHNWFALALAVRGEGISDFPLCNKSFDLSYCGNDL